MCKCVAGNVACCCFSCALSLLLWILFFAVLVGVGIALAIYFGVLRESDIPGGNNFNFNNAIDDAKDSVKHTYDKIKN